MQVHVDPLGGWSGDMFVAACLDARPDLWPEVQAAIAALKLGPDANCRLVAHNDGVLSGRRFRVAAESSRHGHGPHRAWADIRELLTDAALDKTVARRAIAIFAGLAAAEAEVHGVAESAVTFHEIGAVDSLVDIVAAALLIERLAATRWTASPLPLGGGRVRTAHGFLPVPAPATALLLRGLPTIDDGVSGERVTPTGAAIARCLLDRSPAPPRATPRTLQGVGVGFGTKTFPGISNCLRVLLFDEGAPSRLESPISEEEVGVVEFEIDDQSSEDLSLGLDHLRAREGVLDVVQSVVFGKRGRVGVQVRVLAAPARLGEIVEACFAETTTIGLRHQIVRRAVLARGADTVEIDEQPLRVKTVQRPGGATTAKTEAADVAGKPGHAARSALRRAGEEAALGRLAAREKNAED